MARSPDPQLRLWWQQLIDAFDPQRSTVAEFCRHHEISTASFYQWRCKLRGDAPRRVATVAEPAFLNVQLDGPGASRRSAAVAEIHLPGGVRVDVPTEDPRLLAAAVRALAAGGDGEAAS